MKSRIYLEKLLPQDANTDPDNTASRKILLKNGFTSEKVCRIDGLASEIFGRKM